MALADFAETCDPRRHGGAVPGNLLKTNVKLEGFKLTNFEFRCLTDTTADNVSRDICLFLGCFEYDDVAGNDLANLTVSTHRAGLTKQLFFSDSGSEACLRGLAEGVPGALPPVSGKRRKIAQSRWWLDDSAW